MQFHLLSSLLLLLAALTPTILANELAQGTNMGPQPYSDFYRLRATCYLGCNIERDFCSNPKAKSPRTILRPSKCKIRNGFGRHVYGDCKRQCESLRRGATRDPCANCAAHARDMQNLVEEAAQAAGRAAEELEKAKERWRAEGLGEPPVDE